MKKMVIQWIRYTTIMVMRSMTRFITINCLVIEEKMEHTLSSLIEFYCIQMQSSMFLVHMQLI